MRPRRLLLPRKWCAVGRRGWIAALGVVLSVAFLIGGLARVELSTGVGSFLPSSDPVVEQFHDYTRTFGADPAVVLLESAEPHELLGPDQLPRLLHLEGELARLSNVAAVYGPATILNQIAGRAQDLLAELAGRREGLRRTAEVQARHHGATDEELAVAADRASADFDQRYGSLLAQGLPAGLPTTRNKAFVTTVAYDSQGAPRPQWRFVVPSDHSVAIMVRPREGLDQRATTQLIDDIRSLVAESGLHTTRDTVSGVPAVVAGLGQQVGRELPLVGGSAIVAVALCFWFVPWTRRRRRLLPVGTTLLATACTVASMGWLGRPMSLGVLAFLPVLLGVGSYYPTYWARRARGSLIVVVALATGSSFGALTLSPLPFVQDLGLALGLGVLFACGMGAMLVGRTVSDAESGDGGVVVAASGAPTGGGQTSLTVRWTVIGAIGLVAALGWVALAGLPLQADFASFTGGLPVGEEVDHLKQAMGTVGEVDIVLRGPDVTSPAAIEWMRQAQSAVVTAHGDELRPVISPPLLLSFLGAKPDAEQIRAGLRLLPPYLVDSVIDPNHSVAGLTFGTTVEDAEGLKAVRDEVIRELPPSPDGYRAELTGLPMLAARGQELVSADRYLANLAGLVAAGLLLAIGLRGRRIDAGRAILAGVLATGVGLSLVWATGIALNPLTVALGSLTAAVGCEFTVMLTEAARTGQQWLRRSVALAAITSSLGYLILVVSGIQAIKEFGVLLSGSVLLALGAAWLTVWVWPPRRELGRSISGNNETGSYLALAVVSR